MRSLGEHQDVVMKPSLLPCFLKEGDTYKCGCGEEHEAGDVVLEVEFQGQIWNNICLLRELIEYRTRIHELLANPVDVFDDEIMPVSSPNGVFWCGLDRCHPSHSRLKDQSSYCVKVQRRVNPGENSVCLPWIKALVEAGRK